MLAHDRRVHPPPIARSPLSPYRLAPLSPYRRFLPRPWLFDTPTQRNPSLHSGLGGPHCGPQLAPDIQGGPCCIPLVLEHRVTFARTLPLVVLAALAGFGRAEAQRGDQLGRPYRGGDKGSEMGTGVFTMYFKHDSIYLALTRSSSSGTTSSSPRSPKASAISASTAAPRSGPTWSGSIARATRSSCGPSTRTWPRPRARRWRARWPTRSATRWSSRSRSPPNRDTSEVLVNVAPFFLSDWADVGTVFQTALRSGS